MDIRKLQKLAVDALEDVKAQDIQIFNTTELTSLFDRVIICSGTSNRQTRSLASSAADRARSLGIPVIAMEGEETGEWVLVDIGDIVVHVMQPTIRAYYNLEQIWGGKPVRMKLLPESTRPAVASGESPFDPMATRAEPNTRRAASAARPVKPARPASKAKPARQPRPTR